MIPPTVEPIEGATLMLAAIACAVSVWLLRSAWATYLAAKAEHRCDAVLLLGRGRIENEAIRAAISAGVTYAGWVNAWAPRPGVSTENRAIFQCIWLLIAFGCFVQSLLNERRSRRVVSIIERERTTGQIATTDARAEGRVQGDAEGRIAERAEGEMRG